MTANFRLVIFLTLIFTGIFAISLVSVSSYQQSLHKIEVLVGQRLESIAATSSLAIDGDKHEKIVEGLQEGMSDIEATQEFQVIQSKLRRVKEVNGLKQDIYTVVLPTIDSPMMVFVAMTNEKTFIGNGMKTHPLVKKVYQSAKSFHSSIYEDHEGSWISGYAPIKNKNNNVVAVLEIDFDVNDEILTIRKELLISLIIPVVIVLLSIIVLAFMLAKSITKPIERLIKKVNALKTDMSADHLGGNSKIKEISLLHSEFDSMAQSISQAREKLQDYADNLELKVEERTFELKKSKEEVENILNNLSQGFLAFDSEGQIGSGYSKIVCSLFEQTRPDQVSFHELISPFCDFSLEDFDNWRGLAFSGAVEFDSLVDLLPDQMVNSLGLTIRLSYCPIPDGEGNLVNVICIAEDKTQEKKFQYDLKRKEEYANFILHVTRHKDIFYDYCKSLQNYIDLSLKTLNMKNSLNKDEIEHLSRYIHTIKGESAFNFVSDLVDLAEEVEEVIKDLLMDSLNSMELVEKIRNLVLEMQPTFLNFMSSNKEIIQMDRKSFDLISRERDEVIGLINSLESSSDSQPHVISKLREFFLMEDAQIIFNRFSSLIENLSKNQGKSIDYVVENEGVKIQTTRYEELLSSCVHLFRNAVDHGIETPEERESSNKNAKACINVHLNYTHKDSDTQFLNIVIKDDGRGIDRQKVIEKAIAKGILSPEAAISLSDDAILGLIFHSGMSTKDQVTSISGRGVGLDVVEKAVAKLNGKVKVESILQKGTTFEFEIPLT